MDTTTAHPAKALEPYAFSLTILFLEAVFCFSTSGISLSAALVMLPLSFCLGQACQLACSLIGSGRIQRAVRLVLLVLLGILFGVEYFVYRQFKVFYDPITVAAGASDVAGQFAGTAWGMIVTPSGLAHIVLFLLPAALYALFLARSRALPAAHESRASRARYALEAAGAYVIALAIILTQPALSDLYTARYSFQSAVPRFGLLTSMRRTSRANWPAALPLTLPPMTRSPRKTSSPLQTRSRKRKRRLSPLPPCST